MPTTSPDERRPLRVLFIEDSELDHMLTLTQLRRCGIEPETARIVEIERPWPLTAPNTPR